MFVFLIMYKNDKQKISIIVLMLGVGTVMSYVLHATNLAVVLGTLMLFVLMYYLNRLDKRLQQLEQRHAVAFSVTSMRGWQSGVWLGVLIALIGGFIGVVWMPILGAVIGLWSLLQMFNALTERLNHIESLTSIQHTDRQVSDTAFDRLKTDPSISSSSSALSTSAHPIQDAQSQHTLQPQNVFLSEVAPSTNAVLAQTKTSNAETWWQPVQHWLLHGNPILRVAIVVLMIGVVLLLRFASEHWQLSLSAKLLAIALTGGAATVLGFYLRHKNALFAVALQGAGLAIIFLTLVFAHHFAVIEQLMTASLCFAVLLLITIALSLFQNALYLSILALSMAYLAPLLIPQYHPESVFLLSYYLVINLAVAAINFVKPWKLLHQLAFVATGLIAGSYISVYAKPEQYAVLDQILWLHIGLFIWLSIRYSQLIKKEYLSLKAHNQFVLPPLIDVGLIFSVPILGFSMHAVLMQQSSTALTLGALALGVTYSGLAWWIKQKQSELSVLAKSFFILAVAFISLIFPLWKGAHWSAVGWVVQGAALIVWGVTERYSVSRYLGCVLVFLSSLALFDQFWSVQGFPTLSTTIYAIAQFVAAYFLFQFAEQQKQPPILASLFLALGLYAGALAGVHALAWQSSGLSPYLAISALLLFGFARFVAARKQNTSHTAELILATVLLLLSYVELVNYGLFASFKWLNLIQQLNFVVAQGFVLLLLFLRTTRYADASLIMQHVAASVVWLALAALGPVLWPAEAILSLALAPVVYAMVCMSRGTSGVMLYPAVWGITWIWLIVVSLQQAPFTAYLLPVLNPVDGLSLMVLMALLWAIYRKEFLPQQHGLEWASKVISILMALLVLSSIVVRALHVYLGTPLWGISIWSNGAVQLSLTLLWVILAFVLMTFSSQRHIRQIWFVGAALLGIVVIKLVSLDLSQSGTLTRVVSFIGAGGVMLVIAYLAPLPPASKIADKNDT